MKSWVWAHPRSVRPGFVVAAALAVALAAAGPRLVPCDEAAYDPSLVWFGYHVRHTLNLGPMCAPTGTALDGFLEAWERGDLTARDRWLVAGADQLPAGRADRCSGRHYHYRGRYVLRVESADRVNDPWEADVLLTPSGDRLAIQRVRVERWQPTPWLTFSGCARSGDTILRTASFAIVVRPAGFPPVFH